MDVKFIFCFILLIFWTFSNGQSLESKQIKKIKDFGISYESDKQIDSIIEIDLLTILELDRKRRKNKTYGIILSGAGILTTAFGTSAFTKQQVNPYSLIVGGVITGIGLVEMGVSIPLFRHAKKRKKERNKIIEKYNSNWAEE